VIKALSDLPSHIIEREGEYFEYLISEEMGITLLSEGECYSALLSDGEETVFISPRISSEEGERFVSSLYSFASENELPLRIIDVVPEELPGLVRKTRSCRITANGESFTVDVENELSHINDIPEVMEGGVYLSEPVF
jgi:hypothetical protein